MQVNICQAKLVVTFFFHKVIFFLNAGNVGNKYDLNKVNLCNFFSLEERLPTFLHHKLQAKFSMPEAAVYANSCKGAEI